jgi:hypothetical protein
MNNRSAIRLFSLEIKLKFSSVYLTILLSIYSLVCFSQNIDFVTISKKSTYLVLSYTGSMIYSGARVGFEFPVTATSIATINKSGFIKDFEKEQFITTQLSWYHHPAFQDNIYLTAGWKMRRTKSTGFFTEFSPEIGISRAFLGGTTYQVDDNGNVTIKKYAGYFYAVASVGGGIGYDFSKTKQKPFSVFSKLNILTMYPYNSTIYLRPTLEIGLIYKPANFLSFNINSKHRTK